jgi:hypothetical protein
MNKITYGYRLLFICMAIAVVAGIAGAQNPRIGTSAAPELLIPVGARDLAIGGSSLANTQGVDAIYWNPGGLGRLEHSAEGIFSHMTYIADIGVTYSAVAGNFEGFGVVGLSVKALSFGDISLTTADDPEGEGGRFFSPTYFTLGFSYGNRLTDNISVGGTAKIISERIEQVSASGFAVDVGIQYTNIAAISGLGLGVTVKNIGPQMKFDGPGLLRDAISTEGGRPVQPYSSTAASFELPSLVEIGVSYVQRTQDNMMWSLNSSFTNNNLYLDEYRIGGEYGYFFQDFKLFGRAGYAFIPQAETDANIFGVTFGFGASYNAQGVNITFDYAYRQVEFFDNNNVISIKLGF